MVQIIAIIVLLLERDKDAQLLRFWFVGETLLVIAAILTIVSGVAYLRAVWPVLGMDEPKSGPES